MGPRKFLALAVDNWPAKVLSLALAIILFVIHRMSMLETRYFFTPLVIENLSTMMPSSSYPMMIRVSLRGEAYNLYSILENDVQTYVDMAKFDTPGTYDVLVQWRKKGTAMEVEPLQIFVEPMEITFSLDYKISKFVPVTANFMGQLEVGYNMTSYSLNPNQVIVEGPAAIMGGISELNTELIDLGGRRSDFSVTAAILRREPLILIRGDGTTEFSGAISQIIPVRNISDVPILITGIKEGFTGELEIKTGSIHLEGGNYGSVESFEPPPDFLKVDCSAINEVGTYVLRVMAGAAEGLNLTVEPEEVKIEVTLEVENQDEVTEDVNL